MTPSADGRGAPAGHPPVVVVGAGPVGLVTAGLLARRGVACVVLERHHAPYLLPRAVHLDGEAVRVLQGLGLHEAFARISRPAPGMRLLDAAHEILVDFPRAALGADGFPEANLFHQPDLEVLLREHAATSPLIDLRSGWEVVGLRSPHGTGAGGPVMVDVRDPAGRQGEIEAAAVLGCDGTESLVRHHIGAPLRDLHFEERWLVVDVRSPAPLPLWGGVHQLCDPVRPATLMHVTGDRYRWEFRLGDSSAADETDSELQRLLADWVPTALRPGVQIVRSAPYTFRARVATRWRSGRVLLLGDAAHQTPPFIGQGLGAGLRDAGNLAWKLAAVLDGADEALLDTYESERRGHVTTTTRGAVLVGWALTGGQDRAAAVRRFVTTTLGRVPGLPQLASGAASPRLGRSRLLARRGRPGDPVGRTLPQPVVRQTAEGPAQALDDVLGPGWVLLTRGDADRVRRVHPGVHALAVADLTTVAGTDLQTWMRRRWLRAVLVRPDRVVAAADAFALRLVAAP